MYVSRKTVLLEQQLTTDFKRFTEPRQYAEYHNFPIYLLLFIHIKSIENPMEKHRHVTVV